jgi:DNA-binding NarL/FixJ family response regulator
MELSADGPGGVHGMRATRRTTVVVADGDPLARRVLRDAFQSGPAFAVAAEARDGVEALELVRHYAPDVALVEVSLNRVDGVEVTRRLVAEHSHSRVLVYATRCDELTQFAALRAGASGFLSKESPVEDVVAAAGRIAGGEVAVSSAMTMSLLRRLRGIPLAGHGMRPVSSTLTTREWQVLDLLSAGEEPGTIAAHLGLSEETVVTHVKHVGAKLGVDGRQEVVAAAHRLCRQHAVAS